MSLEISYHYWGEKRKKEEEVNLTQALLFCCPEMGLSC